MLSCRGYEDISGKSALGFSTIKTIFSNTMIQKCTCLKENKKYCTKSKSFFLRPKVVRDTSPYRYPDFLVMFSRVKESYL